MGWNIEEFLGLTPEIIEERKKELIKSIADSPPEEYLEKRLEYYTSNFGVLARAIFFECDKNLFEKVIYQHAYFDGIEEGNRLREGLLEDFREGYIICALMRDLKEAEKQTKH